MQGAAPQLEGIDFVVDAEESRQFSSGVDVVEALKAQGRLGDVVAVHLGTNGPIFQSEMDELMAALSDVPQVILITTSLPDEPRYDFKTANNALIYDTVATHPERHARRLGRACRQLRRRLLLRRRHPHEIDGRPVLRRRDQQLREAR